ncbi:hypothetical protein K458DRAFT_377600 [Lentithecium fluviatile CBS 122367]|uniref:BTB domain-containing protein n=1 Tax=Lentithecium fluviatile CBS 122367 TaxID=1168545 RepID=A0A6G1IIS8_9PLEO|nr:hypothetical protein K458DRAFT_377600 [Lentithecium fluviatile CBS 122367]
MSSEICYAQMAPTFEDLIQSHQFTFFVGQEGKPIVVHAAAVAATSQQLDALMNGGMEESETRCAIFKDVQVDDFIRFCEYAYCGDYTVPQWKELLPEPTAESDINQQNGGGAVCDEWAIPVKKGKKSKKGRRFGDEPIDAPPPAPEPDLPPETGYHEPSWANLESEPVPEPQYEIKPISRAPLRTQFNNRKYLNDGGPKALVLQRFEPKTNSAANQNFTPVFLAHARLYCFAHLRLIAPLQALTLDKLHQTLMGFKLYSHRVGDIIELARYAYSNPHLPDRKDNGTLDDLRKLVVEYILCEIDTIGESDEFVKYMEEGGEFVGDFWRMAKDYMV